MCAIVYILMHGEVLFFILVRILVSYGSYFLFRLTIYLLIISENLSLCLDNYSRADAIQIPTQSQEDKYLHWGLCVW
jgi:hypothetical protein